MMRLSDFLDRHVETESGQSLGRVFDVRARANGDTLEVEELMLGRRGLAERLGLGEHGRRKRSARGRHVVPWSAVVRIDARRGRIIVRDEHP